MCFVCIFLCRLSIYLIYDNYSKNLKIRQFTQPRSQQTFLVKGQIVHILGFVGHVVPVTTIQLSADTATDNTETNGCACVPIKLYLQTQSAGCNLWILDLNVHVIYAILKI